MTGFRLTQISDTHLARRFAKLTANFEALSDHIDTTRPDLVLNTGDMAFDAPGSPDDLEFAPREHRGNVVVTTCKGIRSSKECGIRSTTKTTPGGFCAMT